MDAAAGQDERYAAAAAEFGAAIERLARAYEADADPRRDLIQDIHLALWRSLAAFDGRCSLRTWVYRVGHNTAVGHVQKRRRWRSERWTTLDTLENVADADDPEKILRDVRAGVALRIVLVANVDGRAADVTGQEGKRLLGRANIFVVLGGRDEARAAIILQPVIGLRIEKTDIRQFFGVREGKTAKHEGVYDRELRGYAADAEGENDGGENAECLFFEQNAAADTDVLAKIFEDHRDELG